jgi:hypothetical protein
LGYISGGGASASYASSGDLIIPYYSGTTFYKTISRRSAMQSGLNRSDYSSSTWKNAAAITRVDLTLDANNFAAGSVVSLYGLN